MVLENSNLIVDVSELEDNMATSITGGTHTSDVEVMFPEGVPPEHITLEICPNPQDITIL